MSRGVKSLAGKVVFLTGAARGIGEHTARLALAQGAKVALTGLEPERLEELARELGPCAIWFECDVTDSDSLERAVSGTVHAFGGIDVVVANAGVGTYMTVSLSTADSLAKTIEINLLGVMRTVSATLPHVVERRGYLLLVASASAFAAMPGMSAYGASKAGVEQFGNVLRQEVASKDVGVGVAYPCWIDTDMVRDLRAQMPTFDRIHATLPGPLGSYTSVDACAKAFVTAMTRRSRRVYVPRSLAMMSALRTVVLSSIGDLKVKRTSKRYMAQLENEMEAHRPGGEVEPAEQAARVG
jgi:NAD(P)-dependent dehydrogenase (short-subunit alcohol dehydrogenase family)